MPGTACPSPAQLERLFQGGLSPQDVATVEDHLLECSNCLQQLKKVMQQKDFLSAVLGENTPSDALAAHPVVTDLMEKLVALRADAGTSAPSHTEASVPPSPAAGEETQALGATSSALQAALTSFLAPAKAPDELGRLGDYRILQILGHGGMGVVYRAEDIRLRRAVAIKAMLPTVAASANAGKRFLREAQAMAAVEHDHIVRIYQVAEDRGVPFLAMEFLKGESLDERLKRPDSMQIPDILRIGREMAEGLDAAHAQGLIHRDIKPGNIWLEGSRARVKILDFGLARAVVTDSQLTQEGAIVGTPAYMAPEQSRGGVVDGRSDLFSAGIVLYRMCTGLQPFKGPDAVSTLLAVAGDTPRPPHAIRPTVPVELSDLVMKLLEKDPSRRIATATELARQLQIIEQRLPASPPLEDTIPLPAGPLVPSPRQPAGATPGSQTDWRPTPAPRKSTLPRFAATALMLLGVAGLIAGIVIYLQPPASKNGDEPPGAFVIETNDPDFSFQVEKNGVKLKDKKTGREYLLTVVQRNDDRGEYELEVTDIGGDLSFKTKKFTIRRGNMVVANLWFERKTTAEAKNPETVGPENLPTAVTPEWVKAVSALPPARQLELVTAMLRQLNPNFKGEIKRLDNDPAAVTRIELATDNVSDLTPLSALQGLKHLRCVAFAQEGKLSDLAALKNLKLVTLDCSGNPIADLSPLREMNLAALTCNGTRVADLTPLQNMTSLTSLYLTGTPVANLKPLKGLKLTALFVNQTKVAELTPLAGMPLETFSCGSCPVTSLSPLAGMKLTGLDIANTKVTDLSPLKEMKLQSLTCSGAPIGVLTPLKDMPLAVFQGQDLPAIDLTPLAQSPLKDLGFALKAERDAEIIAAFKTLETINGKPAAEMVQALQLQYAAFETWRTQTAKLGIAEQLAAVAAKFKERNPGFDGSWKPKIEGDVVTEVIIPTDNVADLWPLRALPGLKILSCQGGPNGKGKLTDLSPLRGLKLKELHCGANPIRDLGPLQGMPLTKLNAHTTQVVDLAPLKGTNLTTLHVAGSFSDLKPLQGMPLEDLSAVMPNVTNLDPLQGMPLVHLSIAGAKVTDLAALNNMKLTSLNIQNSLVSDLKPLAGMPLKSLHCPGSKVTDLSPLQGMKLVHLACYDTKIHDLSPLRGLPLEGIFCHSTPITDLSPLQSLPLTGISCNFHPERDLEVLKAIKTLTTINGAPAAKFLHNAEVKHAAFDLWRKGIQLLPAGEQVEAVAAKLKEHNPGFDGKIDAKFSNGTVTELAFSTDHVTDIWPVRALPTLKSLTCNGTAPGKGKLADLSPLTGLKLEHLRCGRNPIISVAPLKGTPLKTLHIPHIQVADLRPLAECPLTDLVLGTPRPINLTQIANLKLVSLSVDANGPLALSAIAQPSLTHLRLSSAANSDLTPLKNLKLKSLRLISLPVVDLSPIRGMPLEVLNISGTKVTDLRPLLGLKLKSFSCDATQVHNLSPLRGMPLEEVICNKTRVTKIEVLTSSPLKKIQCDFIAERDLVPLRAIKTLAEINGVPAAQFLKTAQTNLATAEAWRKATAALPAEKQAEAVSLKLKERNPGFNGTLNPKIENGIVTEVIFSTDHVTDLWPIRALPALKTLSANGTYKFKGQLYDITPLKGMPLHTFICKDNHVVDLSPLAGSKLTELTISSPDIADLSPLRGSAITKLSVYNSPFLTDLTPLEDLKIVYLIVGYTGVTDLTPLKRMPLKTLGITALEVADLQPIRHLPLESLWCQNCSKITSFDAIRHLKLRTLECNSVPVADLSPLRGMPLTTFQCMRMPVRDYSPLVDTAVEQLIGDFQPERDLAALRALKKLKEINGKPAATVLKEMEAQVTTQETWRGQTAKLSPVKQLPGVLNKLRERNPDFDGVVTHKESDGKITELVIVANKLTDLMPLQALDGLQKLEIKAKTTRGLALYDLAPLAPLSLKSLTVLGSQVSDLRPVSGMKLATLTLHYSRISDLRPLAGMPLTSLNCSESQVSDLTPLKGMKLSLLHCTSNRVRDLSPLSGMPLKTLVINNCQISDLSPLTGMQLDSLTADLNPIADYSPLIGMPLTNLSFDFRPMRDTQVVRSLAMLKKMRYMSIDAFWQQEQSTQAALDVWLKSVAAMPPDRQVEAVTAKLKEMNPKFNGKISHKIVNDVVAELAFSADGIVELAPVRALPGLQTLLCSGSGPGRSNLFDLSPLKGLKLTALGINHTRVSTLEPLRGMPLTHLYCSSTSVSDLKPLAGMRLQTLHCSSEALSDLSPLGGMPLTSLAINGSRVADLSPLAGMPLTQFNANCRFITDLTPLKGMPLKHLTIADAPVGDISTLSTLALDSVDLTYRPDRDGDVLRGIKTLAIINGRPAATFWKEVAVQQAEFDLWCKQVAALPEGKQLDAVSAKLKELNPNFDGALKSVINNGHVTELVLNTDNVVNIMPIQALPTIKVLDCRGSQPGASSLYDLSPLRGLSIGHLQCDYRADRHSATLRAMRTLETINGQPVADFWKGAKR